MNIRITQCLKRKSLQLVCVASVILGLLAAAIGILLPLVCLLLGLIMAWHLYQTIPPQTARQARRWVCIAWASAFGLWGPFSGFPAAALLLITFGESAAVALDNHIGMYAATTIFAGSFTAAIFGWGFRSVQIGCIIFGATAIAAALLAAGAYMDNAVFVAGAIIAWSITVAVAITPSAAAEGFLPKSGHCVQCGYCLSGIDSGRCPECGLPNVV